MAFAIKGSTLSAPNIAGTAASAREEALPFVPSIELSSSSDSSHVDKERDTAIKDLAKECFGSAKPLRKLPSSDACELSLDYAYFLEFKTYIDDRLKAESFLTAVQDKFQRNIRVLGPTIQDLQTQAKDFAIKLDYLSVKVIYEKLTKNGLTLKKGNRSDFRTYLNSKIIFQLNRGLRENLTEHPDLYFASDSGTYWLESRDRKSFVGVMDPGLLKKCADVVANATAKLEKWFS